ncbi:hypothetical protein [Deinococcus sedimenti]|nr:hypothetical protein [Deinococcus sedimenti]
MLSTPLTRHILRELVKGGEQYAYGLHLSLGVTPGKAHNTLRDLHAQGLAARRTEEENATDSSKPPRTFYALTPEGLTFVRALLQTTTPTPDSDPSPPAGGRSSSPPRKGPCST